MRFNPSKCPECGAAILGTVDTLPCRADVTQMPDGSYEYDGHTEMFYDNQTTEEDANGRWHVECAGPELHDFYAECEQ